MKNYIHFSCNPVHVTLTNVSYTEINRTVRQIKHIRKTEEEESGWNFYSNQKVISKIKSIIGQYIIHHIEIFAKTFEHCTLKVQM